MFVYVIFTLALIILIFEEGRYAFLAVILDIKEIFTCFAVRIRIEELVFTGLASRIITLNTIVSIQMRTVHPGDTFFCGFIKIISLNTFLTPCILVKIIQTSICLNIFTFNFS